MRCGTDGFNMHDLKETDVIKYSTQGKKPHIETIKTVDGQSTQISNLRSFPKRKAYTGNITLVFPPNTGIFGLGQDEEGKYNRRGTKYYLYQHNMRTPMPLMTEIDYGILFDCHSLMIFDDTGEGTKIFFDTVDQIDFYIIAGSMDAVISEFRFLTGEARMLSACTQ